MIEGVFEQLACAFSGHTWTNWNEIGVLQKVLGGNEMRQCPRCGEYEVRTVNKSPLPTEGEE